MAADGKVNTLDKFFTQTPRSGEKRGKDPDSPECISPSLLQVEKQARLASSSNDSDKTDIQTCKEINETAKGQMETVFHLSEVVCATLKNQDFLESIIPMISEKVIESITPRILKLVDDSIKPHLEKAKQCQEAITHKEIEINKQNKVIKSLQEKLNNVETRIEEQEQYSRRTSLRFNNVKVPTNRKGEIIQPVDTDSIVLGICNKDLGLKLDINHIGRSHPIGEPKDGKISIITRFLTYRQRQLVFRNKKKLKGNPDKMFIAENLTKHRYDLIKRLNTLRKTGKIHSYWTHDGSVLVKKTEQSRTINIKNRKDVYKLGGEILEEDENNDV